MAAMGGTGRLLATKSGTKRINIVSTRYPRDIHALAESLLFGFREPKI